MNYVGIDHHLSILPHVQKMAKLCAQRGFYLERARQQSVPVIGVEEDSASGAQVGSLMNLAAVGRISQQQVEQAGSRFQLNGDFDNVVLVNNFI